MKYKILPAVFAAGAFMVYLAGCSKRNAVALSGGGCDTTNVSYSKQVVTILEDNCYQCHKGAGASSGIDFSNYDAFKGWAGTDYVVGDLTAAPGFTPMPYGQPSLSGCDINTIAAWIHQGRQNN